MASLKELLVVIPHSGLLVPPELSIDSLDGGFPALLRNVDWHTNYLYDLTDLLENQQVVFPYCSLLLEANRHPEIIEDCVPLVDVDGKPLYRPDAEPSEELRRHLAYKYLRAFNRRIEALITAGAEFLLDGHSTIVARGMKADQIDIMSFQHSRLDTDRKDYAPLVYAETYAEALQKRLPDVTVTVNASEYYQVYGHICAAHSVNGFSRAGKLVPALSQETSHGLYLDEAGRPDLQAIDRLRRAFADALVETLTSIRRLHTPSRVIDLNVQRQSFDFDCGLKALQMVLAYYGVEEREDLLLSELGTEPELGTPVSAMVEFAQRRGFEVRAGPDWTLDDVKAQIDEGHPVIVLVQAWAERRMSLSEWRRNFDDGHYVVVVGYEGDSLFFEDPASFHRTWLKAPEFLARWHDLDPSTGEKLMQFGLVLHGKEPVGKGLRPMQ
jgi:predicted double-glycine peptidase